MKPYAPTSEALFDDLDAVRLSAYERARAKALLAAAERLVTLAFDACGALAALAGRLKRRLASMA